MKQALVYLIVIAVLIAAGCVSPPAGTESVPGTANDQSPLPAADFKPSATKPKEKSPRTGGGETTSKAEVQKVLNLGIMVHLEGWDDGANEIKFKKHASLLREYAALFEKYGARLTLESKEMTLGAVKWNDNVLLEMQSLGHGIGVHADVGGSMKDTLPKMKKDLANMKTQLESLG